MTVRLNEAAYLKACDAFYAVQQDGYTNAKIAAAIAAFVEEVSTRIGPVAEAIWEAHRRCCLEDLCSQDIGSWAALPESQLKNEWREKARAAIAAMWGAP
jgi:hypothetical protein